MENEKVNCTNCGKELTPTYICLDCDIKPSLINKESASGTNASCFARPLKIDSETYRLWCEIVNDIMLSGSDNPILIIDKIEKLIGYKYNDINQTTLEISGARPVLLASEASQ